LQKWTPGAPVQPGAVVLLPDPAPADLSVLSRAIVLSPQTPLVKGRWETLGARQARVARRYAGVTAPAGSTVYLDPQAYAALAGTADGEMVTIEADSRPAQPARTWNAVGRLPGRDGAAARVILLSAHLDHLGNGAGRPGASGDTIYNGADDDASGSIAVLELMEALAKGPRPKRTIVFALFGSEETGGEGSRFFADKPTVPLDALVANLQFEMIGRADPKVPPHTLWLTGYERSTLGAELARRGAKLVQDPHPEQNFFERSDNIQFARRGVVAHTVSSYGLHAEYHTPVDDVRHIDFAHMTDAIQSMLEPIRWLANDDFVPAWLPGKKP
jgi:Zn-dependent M28 family amino/carboxypeptidase